MARKKKEEAAETVKQNDPLKALKRKHGKRYVEARKGLDLDKSYPLLEAVSELKKRAKAKFDESVEIALNLGIDAKNTEQMVRGMIALPHGIGKTIRVAVFAKGEKAKEAEKAGADLVGADELADKILKGEMNFDRCIATPDMMGVVGKLGKVLGPRGLMPNPKLGTVTMDVANAVKAAKSGQVEFRAEKAGIVHAGVGKASFAENAIAENIKSLVEAVVKAKPQSSKGSFLRKATVSTTMGPGLKLDLAEFGAK